MNTKDDNARQPATDKKAVKHLDFGTIDTEIEDQRLPKPNEELSGRRNTKDKQP